MIRPRKLVLFLSPVPPHLEEILAGAGFDPRRITEVEFDLRAPEAFALVLRFQQFSQFMAEFRRMHRLAWLHGLLLLIIDETKDPAPGVQAWKHIKLDDRKTHPGTPIAVEFPNWPRVAMQIAAFARKAGPGQNAKLVIEPSNIPSDHKFLLRRSFGKFTRIRVRPLDEGASGASVYRVTAFKAAGEEHPIPFLAKIGETLDIELEQLQFRKYVRDFIPFNLRPSIISPLSCYGPETGILVEDFIERAIPFHAALRVGDPALLITSLFQSTLRGWRRDRDVQEFSAMKVFRTSRGTTKKEIVRNNKQFIGASAAASSYFAKKYDAVEVIARFDGLYVERAAFCKIHGDLHSRNIFVAAGSAACLIIDYANTSSGPTCQDPACLEVDLLLTAARPQPGRFLKRAYAWPLKPLLAEDRLHCDPWVWEAIRALRIEAEVATDPRPYVLSLIGYFLRFARLKKPQLRKRAVALCIAEWLICQLLNDRENEKKDNKALPENSRSGKRRGRERTTRPQR